MSDTLDTLIAVDIGNSRIKLGRFDRTSKCAATAASLALPIAGPALPSATETFDLALVHGTGSFDAGALVAWCNEHVGRHAKWLVASVHRGAAEEFASAVLAHARRSDYDWPLEQLNHRDIPLMIDVDEPARVGIDRLLAALSVNRIRRQDRTAIVIDSGSATTVDLVSANGAFCGGAIMPGIAMAARALDEQTDALPHVSSINYSQPPLPLGKSTVAAIESGLFWGAVGAIRELVRQLASNLDQPPDVFLTGGASPHIAHLLAESENHPARHVPDLVLAGIAIVDRSRPEKP